MNNFIKVQGSDITVTQADFVSMYVDILASLNGCAIEKIYVIGFECLRTTVLN